MINRVKVRAQELWGKEVITEAEAFAQAICEEIEKMNQSTGAKAESKKVGARKAADE